MYPSFSAPSEFAILGAAMLLALGLLMMLLGYAYAGAHPNQSSNPGDSVGGTGVVMIVGAAWLTGSDEWMTWSILGAAIVMVARMTFALGHHATSDRRYERGWSGGSSAERRRARLASYQRVAREAVRRYREEQAAAAAAEKVEDVVGGDLRADRGAPPPRSSDDEVMDAEFHDVEDEDEEPIGGTPALPAPEPATRPGDPAAAGSTGSDAPGTRTAAPAAPAPDDEILVRFETPVDAAALFSRPDRPRTMFQAILDQLGEGSSIIGIRARRG